MTTPGRASSLDDTMAAGADADAGVPRSEDLTGRKNLLLLIQLRWFAVAGQVLSILVVNLGLGIALPVEAMSGVILFLVVLNAASHLRLQGKASVTNIELFTALVFDVGALTAQLALSGGATNPFTFLYLLQVTLGAVLLEAWSTALLVALAILCFAGLTVFYLPLDLTDPVGSSFQNLQILGLLICFTLNAGLLVVFVTRISRNLRERDTRLADMRQQAAEEDHIVRMGLLASGAAHELGTPLATLAIILGDWKRMPALKADPELAEEIDAMQAEVQRCKAIVTGILLSAGEARGESAGATTLLTFLDGLVEEWRATKPSARLAYENDIGDDMAIVSESTLRQVVFNVLDNAFEASQGWARLTAAIDDDMLVLTVEDDGPGFDPDILANVGKPYQSSKGRLGGGLGLFLVVNVVRKLGGRFEARNRKGRGAVVTLFLPLEALEIDG